MVCTHIKESDSKKRSNKMSKSGKGGKSEKIVKSSKSGKRSSSKSGKKKKKKRNKRKKRDINKSSHTVWTNKGKRRILNEMEKRNVYFQVHGDVFRDRNADVPMNNATTPDEAVYVAIYKEVFPDVECYEIDVEPTSSPPTSAEEPSSLSDPSVSLSPMISQSPFSVSPTVTMTAPSMNPTTNTTFDDLVLDRANMTGPLEDRSNPINSTWTEANTAYGNRRSTTLIHTWVVVATFLGGTVWMSIFLIRWYGPQKPMRHIRIPSHRHRSSSDGSRRSDEERSVESRLTDDKRMGV